jgi:hypothetical protein
MTFAVSYTFLRRYVGEVTPDEVPRENKGLSRRDAESLAAMLKTREDIRDVKIVAEKEEVDANSI